MTCTHDKLTSWRLEGGSKVPLWYCVQCRVKFEPVNQAQPVPKGYQLVPEVISEAMYKAYHKVDDAAWVDGSSHGANMSEIWDAMLEAAAKEKS